MAIKVNMEKYNQVVELERGDIILLTSGQECEFVRLKQKKFIGIIDDTAYNISVNSFEELIEKGSEKTKEKMNQLEEGDMFYIQSNSGRALLFKYLEFKNGKLIGENPISKGKTTIDPDMFVDIIKKGE